MVSKKQEIKCAWCGESIPVVNVKIKHLKNDFGKVIERRCNTCGRVLAAYLEEEGDFLTKIRTF